MNSAQLPPRLRRALRALERRLFAVLLTFGLGRTVTKLCAALTAMYLLDRVFAPPTAARMVLLVAAAAWLVWQLRTDLVLPLSKRPARADLASLWERQVPGLQDRLLTSVELHGRTDRGSVELLAAVTAEAEELADELRAEQVVPTGRARRSMLIASGALAVVLGFLSLMPGEAWIFFQRLGGAGLAWPSDTRLVLLPVYIEGSAEATLLEPDGPERFRLAVARGSVVSLRVQTEGVIPEEVLAYGLGEPRRLHVVDRGVFVLRLPPLHENLTLRFRGGDDTDGLPMVSLQVGDAPHILDWTVAMTPPAYSGLPIEEGALHEVRALKNSNIELSFQTDRPAQRVEAVGLDGERTKLEADAEDVYHYSALVAGSDEIAITLLGVDGFRQQRAAVLRWDALADRAPQLSFAWPRGRWRTVPGATLPVLLTAEDDYGLESVELLDALGAPVALPAVEGARSYRRLLRLPVPAGGDGAMPTDSRFRFVLHAQDRAEPDPQASRAESDWIEVLPAEFHDQQLAERMVRLRSRVESVRGRVAGIAAAGEVSSLRSARRVRRELEGMVADTEDDLVQRLYSGLDGNATRALQALETRILEGRVGNGALIDTLDSSGASMPGERTTLLLQLSRALSFARKGATETLIQTLEENGDPSAAAEQLIVELDAVLEILIAWEDFESAVNLLRDLLERQRALYLRTQEASQG